MTETGFHAKKCKRSEQLTSMKLKVVLEPSEEGGYTVFVPSLPGCISEGENISEALSNIQEAIELYLEPTEDSLSLNLEYFLELL